jgi:FkbM family methyltransferase
LASPGSTIDAYEPHPDNLQILKDNLGWNNVNGVQVHDTAVSCSESELTLHVNEDNSWRSTVSVHPRAWNESQVTTPRVFPATPLKDILVKPYDLVKMDVEGYEFELIKSVKHQLNQVQSWMIEIHGRGHYDIRELLAIFEKANFSVRLEKMGKTIKSHQLSGLALLHAARDGGK